MTKPYTLLDHTADLRIRVSGTDPADLFKNAGLALFDLITRPDRLKPGEVIEVSVIGDDAGRSHGQLPAGTALPVDRRGKIGQIESRLFIISDTAVSARVSADCYQPERHEIRHEIKAVTYHQIEVSRTANGWQATVVFDV